VHLANIHANTSIVIFGDNKNQLENAIPSDGDNLLGTDSTTSEEDCVDNDADEEEEDLQSSDDEGENELKTSHGREAR
jgi:hypothetical protein